MKKKSAWLMIFVVAVVCLLGPALALPALACGAGAGCCENACNCGMKSQTPGMMPAMAPVAALASFDPSLMAQVAALSTPAPQAPGLEHSVAPSVPDKRSDKDKLYDVQSNYRL